MRLIIIISFCSLVNSYGQTVTDTIAFKKDFEALLKKHGIKSDIYSINVTSNNQSGGQTALVINNNYFKDTIPDEKNFIFRILENDKFKVLKVRPKSGVWLSPFAITNSIVIDSYILDCTGPGGFYAPIKEQWTIDDKVYVFNGYGCNNPCSKYEMTISLNKDDKNEIIIFGDSQDPTKTYSYINNNIIWIPKK